MTIHRSTAKGIAAVIAFMIMSFHPFMSDRKVSERATSATIKVCRACGVRQIGLRKI